MVYETSCGSGGCNCDFGVNTKIDGNNNRSREKAREQRKRDAQKTVQVGRPEGMGAEGTEGFQG